MRASLKLKSAAIGLLAVTACSGASTPSQAPGSQGRELGIYAASWLGLLPGETPEGARVPVALRDTDKGRQIWGESYLVTVDATERAYDKAMRSSGSSSASSTLGPILGTDGKSTTAGSGLSTSPSFGGGSLSTSPSFGSGSLPTAPSLGGATLPTAPSVGAGATLTMSPAVFASAGGTASASDLSSALCTFIEGFFTYLGTCPGASGSGLSELQAAGGCSTITTGLTDKLEGVAVPGNVVTALACVGGKLKSQTCSSTSDSALSSAMTTSFSDCGITISSSGT